MADTFSVNYNLTLPEVGGSNGSWGTKLNADLVVLDAALKAVSDIASAAALQTDLQAIIDRQQFGTLDITGRRTLTLVDGGGGFHPRSVTVDLSAGSLFYAIIGQNGASNVNLTVNFSNRPANGECRLVWFVIENDNDDATLTFALNGAATYANILLTTGVIGTRLAAPTGNKFGVFGVFIRGTP